ncbi:MAG TPA: M48 family metallopeptidase, partial [Enhygromyxa sp.]|nr:M48 family metallopeptidase [Enhygromyxa sp.]
MSEPASQITLAASSAHRRGVLRLLLGLLGFAAIHLGLIIGCVAAPVVAIRAAQREPLLWLLAGPATPLFGALLFVLLRKLVHRASVGATAVDISAAEQPRLFQFLERLCTRARAPMPDRVSLDAGVNAAMLRGSSALGLLFGGPRELVIGLGLVNTLAQHELEAVVAHELGHFSQSSTRVGQWAHRAMVLLRELVLGRDRFVLDVRPLVHRHLGVASSLACRPYDLCTWRIAHEAGCIVCDPFGAPLSAPLDVVTYVAFAAYANRRLAHKLIPIVREELQRALG